MTPPWDPIDTGGVGAIVESVKCNRSRPGELDIRLGREDITCISQCPAPDLPAIGSDSIYLPVAES
jgi:hypothetical protein